MKYIFTLLILSASFTFLSAQNLILNSGFETATVGNPTGNPIPAYPATLNNWTATSTDGEFILEPTLAYAGNGFLSVLQNSNAYNGAPWLGSGGPGYDQAGQVFSVQPNSSYDLLYWYRAGDGSRYGYGAGNMVVHVEAITPANSLLTSINAPTTLTWQLYTKTFVTGPNDTQAILLFASMGTGNVDTWYDDVEIYPSLTIGMAGFSDLVIRTYPNPVSDLLFVSGSMYSSIAKYQLLDMLGNLVSDGTLTSNGINVSEFKNGLYLLKVWEEGKSSTKRVMISH
jgi:hypothetical protein